MFVDPKITFGEGVTPTPTDIRYARVALESQLAQDQRYGRGVSQVRHHLPTGSVCVATHEYGLTYLHITASPEAGRKKTVKARSSTSSTPTKYVIASVVGTQITTATGDIGVSPQTLQFWKSPDGEKWEQFYPSLQISQLLQTPRVYPITEYPVHFVQVSPLLVFGVWVDSQSPSGWSWGVSSFDTLSFGTGTHLPMPDGFFPGGLFIQQAVYGGENCIIFNVNAGVLDQGAPTYRYLCWLDLISNQWVFSQDLGGLVSSVLGETSLPPQIVSASGGPSEPLTYLAWVTPITPLPNTVMARVAISLSFPASADGTDCAAGAALLFDPNTAGTNVLKDGFDWSLNNILTRPYYTFSSDPSGDCFMSEALAPGQGVSLRVFSDGVLQTTTVIPPPAEPDAVPPLLWATPFWTPVGTAIAWQPVLFQAWETPVPPSFTILPPKSGPVYIQRPTPDLSPVYPFLTATGLRDFLYGGLLVSPTQTTETRTGVPPPVLNPANPNSVYALIPGATFSFFYGFGRDFTPFTPYALNPLTHLMYGPNMISVVF